MNNKLNIERKEGESLDDFMKRKGFVKEVKYSQITEDDLKEFMKIDPEPHYDRIFSAQFNGLLLLDTEDDEEFLALYQNKNLVIMCTETVMNQIEERAKKLGL